ncbi:MAG: tetratricopeptide repeat protein [Terracidiphilus sp.]
MKRFLAYAFLLVVCLMVAEPWLLAQAPAVGDQKGQSKLADESKKPAQTKSSQPGTATQSSANPFPEDTSTVPVMPSKVTPPLPEGTYRLEEREPYSSPVPLRGEDVDPVRSPDDPAPTYTSSSESDSSADSSSSLTGLGSLLPKPGDDETSSKKRKLTVKEPTHQEAASKDIEVGSYYLDRKNWKAALSRFESAMILDPENPEVYWGLAQAEHHLGDYAHAKEHYLKLLEYDPDGPHGKQARRELKDPALEKAQSGQPAAGQPK